MSARIELRWFTPRHATLVGRSAAEVAQRLWVEQSTKEGLDIASPEKPQGRSEGWPLRYIATHGHTRLI